MPVATPRLPAASRPGEDLPMIDVRRTPVRRNTAWSRLLVAALLWVALPSWATDATPLPVSRADAQGVSSARLQRLHDYMRRATGDDGYPGGVTLVARNGRIVDWQAYG